MIRSPATLTIANFNRQTLADLLRPVLDRAMTQGMVGTNVVLEIVAEALSKIGDNEIRTFLDPKTGKLRGGLEIRIEETLSMSRKWRDWDANHGNEDWMLRKSGRTIKKNEFLKSLILSSWRSMQKLHGLEPKDVKTLVEGVRKVYDAMCDVKPTDNRPGLGNTYGKQIPKTGLLATFYGDQAINTMMMRMGMAWWYRRYDKTEELENAERYAKENKIGW